MAATAQLANSSRTAAAGHLPKPAALCLFACLLLGCAPKSSFVGAGDPAVLFKSARSQYKHGDLKSARQTAELGYSKFKDQPASDWYWRFRLQCAEMLLWNGQTKDAEPLLAQPPPPAFPGLIPRYQELRGYLLYRTRSNAPAHRLLTEAAEAAHTRSDFELEADIHLLLGMCVLNYEDDGVAARAHYEEALDIAEKRHFDYQQSAALLDLGLVEMRREHYGDAIPLLDRALKLSRASGAAQLHSLALLNIASCYHNLGELDKALPLLKEAASKPTELATASLSEIYSETGNIYLQMGEIPNALRYFHQALDAVREDAPIQFSLAASSLARALEITGSLDEAARYNKWALGVTSPEDVSGIAFLNLTEGAIAQDRRQYTKAVQIYRKVIHDAAKVPSALWQAYAGLAAAHTATGELAAANLDYEKALQVIASNRADQLQSEYKITFLSDLIRFYQDYVELLMKQNQPGRALEIADSSRASVLTEDLSGRSPGPHQPLLGRLQKAAKAGSCIFLFYWLAPRHSYLWAITGTELHAIPLADEKRISQDVDSYRVYIQQEKRDPLASGSMVGRRLYRTLIAPAADFLPAGGRVVVVPDGPLHGLNFETLIVEKPKPHYWIEDVTLTVAPSLSILQAGQGTAPIERSLLAMGNPVTAGTGYPPLPETALEIERVQRHYPQTTAYTKERATPAAYRSALPQNYSTIHFATHVEANEQSPLDSAIILSPQRNAFKLFARDVAEIPLRADLVTISACRGAGSRTLSGEGLVGFAWAFFQAGARNVVTSLWDADDRSTASLMDNFYGGVQDGKAYCSALREAKLQMLGSQFSKPYYWAPFQLYSLRVDQPTRPLPAELSTIRPTTKPPGIPDIKLARRRQTASVP
jgi:CHAT domain-containing protein